MLYFILTLSIMHLTIMAVTVQINKLDTAARANPYVSEVFKLGIASLAEIIPCYYISEQTPHILCYLAKK
ncbi:Uncharacterized protein HZ326_29048 [Fusarium oxysporum f. sp. albedinis]|nr:Uncharacterized protein HZ326_29048 [Fusarium oxysporum f. sp. albedinis]